MTEPRDGGAPRPDPRHAAAAAGPAGPPAYGPPGYGPPATDSGAVWALTTAVASWVLCPGVLAVAALALASGSARRIAGGSAVQGKELVRAARLVAWGNLALCGLLAAAVLGWGLSGAGR